MDQLLSSLLILLSSVAPTVAEDLRAALIREEVKRSTVMVVLYEGCTTNCTDEHIFSRGSGVMFTPKGQVMTNKHVITNERGMIANVIKIYPTGKDERINLDCAFEAKSQAMSDKHDIAFLEPVSEIPCDYGVFMLPRNFIAPTGTDIQIIGYPVIGSGLPSLTVTNGQISGRLYNDNNDVLYLKTDAKVISGVSGGGVIDDKGNLIGIATARTFVTKTDGSIDPTEEQLGLIVPAYNIWEAIDELTGEEDNLSHTAADTTLFLSGISHSGWLVIEGLPLIFAVILLAILFTRSRFKRSRQAAFRQPW